VSNQLKSLFNRHLQFNMWLIVDTMRKFFLSKKLAALKMGIKPTVLKLNYFFNLARKLQILKEKLDKYAQLE